MRSLLFSFLLLVASGCAGYAAPFEFTVKGEPGLIIKLDREYSCTELSATDPAEKKDVRVFMFIPKDEQSSMIFSIGPDAKGETEATVAKKYAGAKTTRGDGRINKKKVQWLRWRDPHHLYSSCEVTLADNTGTERLVSIWLIANTPKLLKELEASFSTIGFF